MVAVLLARVCRVYCWSQHECVIGALISLSLLSPLSYPSSLLLSFLRRRRHRHQDQHARNMVLSNFKMGTVPCLIATDVAARGLDVKEVRGCMG